MPLRLERRAEPGRAALALSPVVALGLTLAIAAATFGLFGYDGIAVARELVLAPLLDPGRWPDLALKAAPLTIIAVGLAIGFRANVWNVGAEGQYVMGAVAGTGVALATDGREGAWILPLMAAAGLAGGAAWAAIPAALRVRLGVSEILTSLMLNYVALQALIYLVRGPWRDPGGFSFPQTRMFSPAATMPPVTEGSLIHRGVPLALLVAALGAFLLGRTVTGFGIKAVGFAPAAAALGGFDARRTVWWTLLGSGALAGLAGICEAAGPFGQLTPQFPAGYGYTAIIVAFLGRLHALPIVPAALLLAATAVGGEHAQTAFGLPQAATGVFQALLLFALLAVDGAARFRIVRMRIPTTAPRHSGAASNSGLREFEHRITAEVGNIRLPQRNPEPMEAPRTGSDGSSCEPWVPGSRLRRAPE